MNAICALQQRNALAGLPGIQSAVLPGSLGMHEECADSVSEVIRDFLASYLRHQKPTPSRKGGVGYVTNRKCRRVEDCRKLRG
jgi:hypothetical protein